MFGINVLKKRHKNRTFQLARLLLFYVFLIAKDKSVKINARGLHLKMAFGYYLYKDINKPKLNFNCQNNRKKKQ